MGLRDFLLNLQTGAQGFNAGADSAEALRKSIEQRNFSEAAPSMIAQGDVGGLTGALAKFDPNKAGEIALAQSIKNKGNTPMTPQAIDALKLPQPAKDVLKQMKSMDQQQGYIKDFGTTEQVAVQEFERGRRMKRAEATQIKDFRTHFRKVEDEVMQDQKQLDKTYEALKQGTVPGDAVVFNMLARKVGEEKGPLSEGDVARFINKAFAGSTQKFENWVSGDPKSQLTDDQKAAYKDLLDLAYKNWKEYKDVKIGRNLADSLTDYNMITDKGTPDKAIMESAKRHGFEFKDGKFVKGKTTTTLTGPSADIASQIDPANMADAKVVIDAWAASGKEMPEKVRKTLLERYGKK